ncbi:MAG: zinc ribbon domain-containing protein [Dehalococcoidia bacterium]
MPIYEYLCHSCRRIVSIFQRSISAQAEPVCPHCQGGDLERRISRVIIAKGARRRLDEIDRDRLMGQYGGMDKGSQAAWARRVAGELGEAGTEFREMAEKVEAGEDVWDLYDPAPMLDYKINEKKEQLSGGSSASEPSEGLD